MSTVYRQVIVLAAAQALFQTASVLVMTVGGLAGREIASDPQLATAPIAAMFLGTAAAMAPAAWLMTRYGRRAGFVIGALLGTLGGILAAFGVWAGSLTYLSAGTFLIGAYGGTAQYYRFAAAEVADDAFRPRAISLVLAGGIIAALAGPELGRLGSDVLDTAFLGSFLALVLVAALAMVVTAALRIPAPTSSNPAAERPRSLGAIVSQPAYLVALFGAATGSGVMILAMTATPIAMVEHHHTLTDASRVIQAHVLGMFIPSFFTGSLIARFGVLPVMLAGVAVLGGHVAMTLSGTGFPSFLGALVFLGVGWNFLFVGGTALLTQTYTAAERGRAQATNDLVIYAVGLLASLSAGTFLGRLGWQMLNLALLPWLVVAAALIIWLAMRKRTASAAASGSA